MESLKNKDTFSDLIICFLKGSISSNKISQLEELLNHSKENQQFFQEMKEAWISSSLYIPESSKLDTIHAWENVYKSINTEKTNPFIKQERSKYSFMRFIKVAAGWAALITLGSLSTMFVISQKEEKVTSSTSVVSTPLGSRSEIILPDGTQVWLNAGTTVRYPEKFSNKQRDIYLTGEAFFKVKTDKSRPFIVHTAKLNIKALGTTFNVKAYASEDNVSTTLVEGIVKLESSNSVKKKFTFILKPNQKLTYYTSEPKKAGKIFEQPKTTGKTPKQETPAPIIVNKNINTQLYTSWKDKRWIIDGENLADLAIMLERRYNMKVHIASEALKNYKFSGTIENETMEQVLNYLSLTTPLKFDMQKGQVTLRINECVSDKYKTYLRLK